MFIFYFKSVNYLILDRSSALEGRSANKVYNSLYFFWILAISSSWKSFSSL